ncbi:DUF4843 domain-containing protein [Salinimicrobium sp. WS361]|uniref:DUF4843 domain-containing protein n=1 Tax=Salinimicrobium sp. WS361 TaxID=3425123 RepID=UPI003D6F7BA6
MKNIYTFLIVMVLGFFGVSCERDEIGAFEAEPAVNFVNDSIQYSFVQNPSNEYLLEVPVNILGNSSAVDRYFDVQIIDDSLTTANPELYEIIEAKVPAGAFSGNLIIKLKKSPVLDDTSVSLHVTLVESDDFSTGILEASSTKIIWSNKIIIPAWTYFRYFFTSYPSTKAYRIFIEVTGMTTFSINDYRDLGATGAQALGKAYGDYIRAYNAEHPDAPLVHDDGPNEGEPIIPVY